MRLLTCKRRRTGALLVTAALGWSLCTGVVIGSSTPAWAEPPKGAKIDVDAEFQSAQEAFAAGRFEEALVGLEKVYVVEPDPVLLFNIARCHQELGHWDDAEFAFDLALGDDKLPAQLRQDAAGYLEVVRQKKAEEQANNPDPVATQGTDTAPVESGSSWSTDDLLALGPWFVMGLGGVALLGAGINELAQSSTVDEFRTVRDECESTGQRCGEAIRLGEDVDGGNVITTTLTVTGVVLVGAGVAWWLWPREPNTRSTMLLVPLEGGAMVGAWVPLD